MVCNNYYFWEECNSLAIDYEGSVDLLPSVWINPLCPLHKTSDVDLNVSQLKHINFINFKQVPNDKKLHALHKATNPIIHDNALWQSCCSPILVGAFPKHQRQGYFSPLHPRHVSSKKIKRTARCRESISSDLRLYYFSFRSHFLLLQVQCFLPIVFV